MTRVYFATNRVVTGDPRDLSSYSADILTPTDINSIFYATADVSNINLADEKSGTIDQISNVQQGSFNTAIQSEIASGGKNLLVFIHGFANSFQDAIRRAAFNREWFAASGVAAADTTVVSFTWPSIGQVIAAPPELLPAAYEADQAQAGRSGTHIDAFFQKLMQIVSQFRQNSPNGGVYLLAHSMGNYALQAAVQSWFDNQNQPVMIFDHAFLAAADERYDTFGFASSRRLSGLRNLAARISIYYSARDIAMYLSLAVNMIQRLGHTGPKDKSNPSSLDPIIFRIIDSSEVGDYPLSVPPDASHQYYRRSKKVRDDIAATMNDLSGHLPGGLIKL